MLTSHNNYDYLFKYIVVGDSSSPIANKVSGSLVSSSGTLSFTSKTITSQPSVSSLPQKSKTYTRLPSKPRSGTQAGQESFKAITRSYYKGSIAAFLVFDITCRSSFDNLHKWLYEIKNHSHDRIEITLLGNKIDLKSKREITYDQAETFAKNNGFNYFEVSALTGDRVDEAFQSMTRHILQKIQNKQLNIDGQTSLGVRKGKMQKKEIITRVSSGFDELNSLDKKSGCCK